MRTMFLMAILLLLAAPVQASVVHDEGVHGDLSDDPANPTSIALAVGSNEVSGTVFQSAAVDGDRDFLTFTVGPGELLMAITLTAYSPDNLGFVAVNLGATSFIPGGGTALDFLAGIHPGGGDVGSDLLELMVTGSITGNSLVAGELGPGQYCLVMQQTSPILQAYSLDFVVQSTVGSSPGSWGSIKAQFD